MNVARWLVVVSSILTMFLAQSISAEELVFGKNKLNFRSITYQSCKSLKVTIINHENTLVEKPLLVLQGSKAFEIQSGFNSCGGGIEAGKRCSLYINFCPIAHKSYKATLKINGTNSELNLKGRGVSRGRG